MTTVFDFIVVGAGASGSVLASRLAHTPSKPTVLLLEAGGSNDSITNLSASERFTVAFSPNSPLNWGYKTTPQTQLSGQEIDYARGKGLGGSTAINFCGWVVGCRDDYDEWATLVDDESFGWQNVRRCLDRIETLHYEIPKPELGKYVSSQTTDRKRTGPVHLTYGQWERDLEDIFVAAEQTGLGTNQDVNSGNPLGMGMGQVCIYEGKRMTSSITYLSQPPANLNVLPDSSVWKVLLKGKKAVGVRTIDAREFFASKEVIISGGALNTPQILMLSGIGPKNELQKHGISVIHELPHVGQNLQDHCFSTIGIVMRKDPDLEEVQQSPSPMGWFKLPSVLASTEFESLSPSTKAFLNKTLVPSIEIATHVPPALAGYEPSGDENFLGAMCLIMNPQSRGTVALQSSDPSIAPLINPNFLSHAFDKRVIIDGIRQTMQLVQAPVYAAKTIRTIGPKDKSEEAIWEYVKRTTGSSWHMSCTTRISVDSASGCVDSSFRVHGLEGLRVVDMSVCPLVPNNHTQSTAYIIGEIAAEKMIKEYRLEE